MVTDESASTLRRSLEDRIAAHDRTGAVSIVRYALDAGQFTVPELYDLLAAYLTDIGTEWQSGETEIWEEHFATAVVRTIVEACQPLVAAHAQSPNGRSVVLATPPEEYHDLGLRMTADRFALAGWTVHLLGANVPASELIAAARKLDADAIVLSASTHFHRLSLRPYVDEVAAALPDVRIWVGGAAFALEAEGWARDMLLDPTSIPSLAGQVG
jgi:methanogenic corrinoid protein MtbC1